VLELDSWISFRQFGFNLKTRPDRSHLDGMFANRNCFYRRERMVFLKGTEIKSTEIKSSEIKVFRSPASLIWPKSIFHER